MNKTVVVSMGVLGLAVAGWFGGGVVAGYRAESALQAMKDAPAGIGGGLRITGLQHERGLFNAKGQAELAFDPGCPGDPAAGDAFRVRVDYSMSHLVLPTSVTRFEWQATPLGEVAEMFKAAFGSASALAGQGSVSATGAVHTEMALPQWTMRQAGETLQGTPSRGFLRVGGEALAFGWKVERISASGPGRAMEAQDIVIDVDLRNRYLGTGTTRFGVEQLSTGMGTLEGLSLRSQASENGDRLDLSVTPAVRRVKAGGVDLSDLAMDITLKGMDTRSVETLNRIVENSCGMQAMSVEDGRRASEAVVKLLARGMSLGVTRLGGKSADGAISGQLMLELAEAKDGKPSLAAQLKSTGRLEITGNLVPAAQRDMAVQLGFAVAKGNGLTAGFEYAAGLLKVNDRAHDAGAVLVGLQLVDAQLQTLVAGWSRGQPVAARTPQRAVAEAPPSAVTTDAAVAVSDAVPASAPAPTPAPVADCTAVASCVRQTLAAARKADIEEVRKVAGLFDAMPKPDPGNRPVSRQLNSAGIEALKRDDHAGAVAKLRQALGENPRDVEIAANLGFALVKAGQPGDAVDVLQAALVLDPRRTGTWTPLAEAYALSGRGDDARAAMWVSFQWSANREKALAFYQDRAARETRAPLQSLYAHMAGVAQQRLTQAN